MKNLHLKKLKTIFAGEVNVLWKNRFFGEGKEVVSNAGNLITRLDNVLFSALKGKVNLLDDVNKTKFLTDFANATDNTLASLNNELDLVDVWKKWGDNGVKELDALKEFKKVWTKNIRGVSFDNFYSKTSYQISKANNKKFAAELFEAWESGYASKDITGMQNVYTKYGLDPLIDYPPCEGIWGIAQTKSPVDDEIFDRFQTQPNLGGSYASPLINETAYTVETRALKENYQEISQSGDTYYYIKFKMKNPSSTLKFEYGEAIPWFGKPGGATQIKSSAPFQTISNEIEVLENWQYTNGTWIKL